MGKTNGGRGNKPIGAVETSLEIVEALEEFGGAGVSRVASHLDLPTSTVHIHLKTLHELGYVIKDGTEYSVGLRFLERGGIQRKRRAIYEVARQEVDKLSRETGEVANLGVEEGGKRVLLYTAEPEEGIFDNSPVGQFTHMHWTSLGKSMLAHQSDERIREIVDRHGLPRGTDNTITDFGELMEEVATIREQGYAVEDEERREGICSLGIPIMDESQQWAVASISVSGPKNRITPSRIQDELLEQVRETANVVELRKNHYGPTGSP